MLRPTILHFFTRSAAMLMTIGCAALMAGNAQTPASSATPDALETLEIPLFDFETGYIPSIFNANNASLSIQPSVDGGSELLAELNSSDHYFTGVTIRPESPWNWQGTGTFGLAMDIGNPGSESVQLNLDIKDAAGVGFTRSVVIPASSSGSYYTELKGQDINFDTGLRDNPPSWIYDGTKFVWMWGSEDLDLGSVASIALSTISLSSDRQITLDNIRIVSEPETDPDYLTNIVDKFGQSAKADFPRKVKSETDLQDNREVEAAALSVGGKFEDRSAFGGWKDGPRRAVTGFFRTEKIEGKWALIDPEGYLFFSTGIANLRMSNTSTMTGMDFDYAKLNEPIRDKLKHDPAGFNRAPKAAWNSRHVAALQRQNMFEWLPEYDTPLGVNYGYRHGVHTGSITRGESFSFYRANLQRKYMGGDYMASWRDVTEDRMLDWGFTSYGNWVDPSFYPDTQIPYFANGWITGNFKTVSSGNDFWAPLPDPFDPVFVESARQTAQQVASEVQNSPWCVGVFIDNEKSWGRMGTPEGQYGIIINTLSRNALESPTKAAFSSMLKDKYETIDALNEAWGEAFPSWRALRRGVHLKDHNPAKQADYAILLEAFAAEYFRVVDDALNETMPNHLYLGVRFATWGMTPEVSKAASDVVDVLSYNEYREVPFGAAWDFLADLDMPTIIGEFHMGALDSGLAHPGLVHAADQGDRARMFKKYMRTVIDNPYFVGAHWFQYIDSPLTGRAYDGENYNVGFVSVADEPYPDMVEAAKEINAELYTRRFGD